MSRQIEVDEKGNAGTIFPQIGDSSGTGPSHGLASCHSFNGESHEHLPMTEDGGTLSERDIAFHSMTTQPHREYFSLKKILGPPWKEPELLR